MFAGRQWEPEGNDEGQCGELAYIITKGPCVMRETGADTVHCLIVEFKDVGVRHRAKHVRLVPSSCESACSTGQYSMMWYDAWSSECQTCPGNSRRKRCRLC